VRNGLVIGLANVSGGGPTRLKIKLVAGLVSNGMTLLPEGH